MSKKLMYLACVAIAGLFLGGVTWAAHDVTGPLDKVVAVPDDGDWPPNEVARQACDDQILTKYLHFKGGNVPTGIRVTPVAGPSVVTEVTFTTANDADHRDPVTYELSGSNASIDGPYTLIAKGNIVDFSGATAWPRRTQTTTPMRFANTVSYKHYQLLFPTIRNRATEPYMQIAEIELLETELKATKPNPAIGAVITMPLFQWSKGDTAMFHNVYLGTSPNLTAADLRSAKLPGAVAMYYHVAPPLEPGVTYYWRVDEIDAAGAVTTGDVWSVMIAPKTAFSPTPRDGDKWLAVNTSLSWQAGQNGIKHDVYFGTDKAAVEARSASVSKGSQNALTLNPGPLVQNTTYYWAVDETTVTGQKVPGSVWSFTTIGAGGGLRGEYFVGTAPGGVPVISRIDPVVDFAWGANSAGAPLPANGWSARWTADLEIAVTDLYTFSVWSEGGTRLWIDGEMVINQWVSWVGTEYASVPLRLEKGIHSLRLEFADWDRNAEQRLYWRSTFFARQLLNAGPVQPPLHAQAVYPFGKAVDVPQEVALTWIAGEKAAKHDVYFGEDAQAVANATTASTGLYRGQQAKDKMSFTPATLAWNKTYYWRIDEVNSTAADSPWKGSVWSFTTANFLVVDNMETYTDDAGNEIFSTWIDGYADNFKSSGSTVGNDPAPFAERTIVHSGRQAMPMAYDNTKSPFFSEAVQTFASPEDWTVNGVNTLVLYMQGVATNGAGQVYVAIEDSAAKSAVVTNTDATLVTKRVYSEWKIPLSQFTGVNMAKVKKLTVGVGDRKTPKAGGAGKVYFDDIGVIKQ